MEQNQFEKLKKKYNTIIAILSVIIVVLAILLIMVKSNVNTIVVEKETAVEQRDELKFELEELLAEHELIKSEYGQLTDQLTEKDSMIIAQAKEIEKLINSQADHRRIKRQLDYLRGITQGYVNQIDSLYTVNQQLTAEIVTTRKSLDSEKQRSFELSQEKTGLEEKITSAAVLRAYNISIKALNLRSSGKESETDRARRADAIRVCFTVSENSLIPAGTKDIYVRIARPDNYILTQGGYTFIYQGNRIQFSEKGNINYNQKSQNVCITYNRGEVEFKPGKYGVNIFADDNEIGSTSFELK